MLTNPSWQTSCNSPLKSDRADITGSKVMWGPTAIPGRVDSTDGAWRVSQLWEDKPSLHAYYCPGNSGRKNMNNTWRSWMLSSISASLFSSASHVLSSAISFWISCRSSSAGAMELFSWALISSRTSNRFSSIDWINSEKMVSLFSAAARAER